MPGQKDDRQGMDRRKAITLAAGGAATLAFARSAMAQSLDLVDQLEEGLLRELNKIQLPDTTLNLAASVTAILELEREADARGLPISAIDFKTGPELRPLAGDFEEAAVPRLVAVIDRSEGRDPALADRAGSLLSQVNAAQRVVPDALKATPPPMLRSFNFAVLKPEYARLFSSMEARPDHAETVRWHAKAIANGKDRYAKVADEVKVPWYFIGLIHGMEASYNFRAHLHNGDFPLTARTRQVPANRPAVWLPPSDWESSAKDAIRLLGFANKPDWSVERTLHRLEAFNGFGYRKVGVPTPYLWSLSNHYTAGKFTSDGKFSAKARSRQCGTAVLMKQLAEIGAVSLG